MIINYAKQAYECFIKNAEESDISDPVKAIENHFQANATDELKAKCKAEGKTAAKAFAFLAAVAQECPRQNGGVHIPPVIGFAIAMHYFQDVPVDWDAPEKPAEKEAWEKEVAKSYKEHIAKHNAEVRAAAKKKAAKTRKEHAKPGTTAAKAPRKKVKEQEFFFDLLETQAVGPSDEGKEVADAH